MVILFGVPSQVSAMLLGLHGPVAWRMPFILFGFLHGNLFVPLWFLACFSGIRWRQVLKGNLRTSEYSFGVECKVRGCLWATPICPEPEQAYRREEIHTKATGHKHYAMIAARETQLEVI